MTEISKEAQYIFFGKVHPERCLVSLAELKTRLEVSEDSIAGELSFKVSISQIIAVFNGEKKVTNIFTLKNSVEDSIRHVVDALGYTNGCGYDVEITAMIDSLGNSPVVFGVGIPVVEKAAKGAGIDVKDIINLFNGGQGGYLMRCLAELREAIRVPQDTGFFCYRGIESIMKYFRREKGAVDDKAAWEMLRSELDIERSNIDEVKKWADPRRHGDPVIISDTQRASIYKITWEIVNKYIKYSKAGYHK